MVVLFHLDAKTHFHDWAPVRNGWVAVDFFFTLSGFVIASAYSAKLTSWTEGARFVIKRFGRLYPLHAAVLFIYVAIELYRLWVLHASDSFSDNTNPRALFEQIFLLQGFTDNQESWNYPAWSISVELWINLAFATLAILFRRRFALCLAALMFCGAVLIDTSDRWMALFAPVQGAALADALHGGFEFVLGFIAYRIFEQANIGNLRPPPFVELAALPLIALAFGYADQLSPLVLGLIFVVLVLLLAFETGPLSSVLRWKPFAMLGTYSYSIYLTHSLYLLALMNGAALLGGWLGMTASVEYEGDDLLILGGPWAMDVAALLVVSIIVAGSSKSYRYLEEPARMFFNAWAERFIITRRTIPVETAQPVAESNVQTWRSRTIGKDHGAQFQTVGYDKRK